MEDMVGRLREATRIAHERLEARLDIVGQLSTPSSRRRLVERFWGLHAGADRVLAPVLSTVTGLDFAGRCRLPTLAEDLAALGVRQPDELPVCAIPLPRTVAEALGLFYVLEGSTLGGHVIRREMIAQGRSMTGLSFLDPYGQAVGQRWRTFLDVLRREAEGEASRGDDMVRGGIAGFGYVEEWLCRRMELADAA